MFEIVLVAAILLGGSAVVQSFRAYDAGVLLKSTERRLESTEFRMSELRDELRRLEKEHARMCQKIVDFADALNE